MSEQQIFIGIVEAVNDPLHLQRLKIRVAGLHTHNSVLLPTEDLPWAVNISDKHIPKYSNVVVMFADFPECQMPVVVGKLPVITQDNNVSIGKFEDTPLLMDGITPSGRPVPKSHDEALGGGTEEQVDATAAQGYTGNPTPARAISAALDKPTHMLSGGFNGPLADSIFQTPGSATATTDTNAKENLFSSAGSLEKIGVAVAAKGGTEKVFSNPDDLLADFKTGFNQSLNVNLSLSPVGASGINPNLSVAGPSWWSIWSKSVFTLPPNPPKIGDKFTGKKKTFEIPAPPIPGLKFCPIEIPTIPELPKIKIKKPNFKPPKYKLPTLDEILKHFGLDDMPCIPVPFAGAFTSEQDKNAFKKYKEKVKAIWKDPAQVAQYVMDYELNITKDAIEYNEGEINNLMQINDTSALDANSFKYEGKTPPINGLYGGPNYLGTAVEHISHYMIGEKANKVVTSKPGQKDPVVEPKVSDTGGTTTGKEKLANTAPPSVKPVSPADAWSNGLLWDENRPPLTDEQIKQNNIPLYENGKPVNDAAKAIEASKQ